MESENKNMENMNNENKVSEEIVRIKNPSDPQSLYFLRSSDSQATSFVQWVSMETTIQIGATWV